MKNLLLETYVVTDSEIHNSEAKQPNMILHIKSSNPPGVILSDHLRRFTFPL